MTAATVIRLLRVPLGESRTGSGATAVEVVLVDACDSASTTTGFTYALNSGAVAVAAMAERAFRGRAIGTLVADRQRSGNRLRERDHRLRAVQRSVFCRPAIVESGIAVRGDGVPLLPLLSAHDGSISMSMRYMDRVEVPA
jgi:hypothetical protein